MNLGRRRNLGRSNIGSREQYRWAVWAAALLVALCVSSLYGCGGSDDGRGAGDSDGAAYPGASDPAGRTDVHRAGATAGHEGTDMDAAHSAAWMEALDGLGLASIVALDVGSGDVDVDPVPAVQATVEVTPTVYVAPPPYAVLDTSVQLTEAQVTQLLIGAGFTPDTWPRMLALGWCESSWSPNVTGSAFERGIWQIHPIHFDSTYDPQGNANAAYRISSGGYDLSAWSCKVPY